MRAASYPVSSTSSRAAVAAGSAPGSRVPAQSAQSVSSSEKRWLRIRTTRPRSGGGRTTTAPGCTTTSRRAVCPSRVGTSRSSTSNLTPQNSYSFIPLSPTLVRPHQAVHPDHVRLHLLQELLHREPGLEVERADEREHPEGVLEPPVTLRGHGAAPAGRTRIGLPEGVAVAAVLGDAGGGAGHVVEHPVHVPVAARLAERRVGIVADDGEGLRAVGGVGPLQRGRDILSLAG